jgi:hypothetical protein
MLTAVRYKLSKSSTLRLLDELKANSIETGSVCVPPGYSKMDIEGLIETIVDLNSLPPNISEDMASYTNVTPEKYNAFINHVNSLTVDEVYTIAQKDAEEILSSKVGTGEYIPNFIFDDVNDVYFEYDSSSDLYYINFTVEYYDNIFDGLWSSGISYFIKCVYANQDGKLKLQDIEID